MARAEHDVEVVLLVRLVRHDGGALREIGAQSARMIEMVVRVDHVLTGFFGARRAASAITASERSSLFGASTTATYSLNSTSRLLCVPPPRSQTPGASC